MSYFFFPALQNVLLDLNVQIHGDTIITRSIGETKLLNVRTMRGFVGITLHADDQTVCGDLKELVQHYCELVYIWYSGSIY